MKGTFGPSILLLLLVRISAVAQATNQETTIQTQVKHIAAPASRFRFLKSKNSIDDRGLLQ